MPLVNYEASDGDTDSSDTEDQPQTNQMPPKSNATSQSSITTGSVTHTSSTINEEPSTSTVTTTTGLLFAKLPAPKTSSQTNSTSATSSSLSDIVVNKSSSGAIKISVPSLKTFYVEDDDSDEERHRNAKRFKGSAAGTGLKALLPKPKTVTSATAKSLIPQSLTRKASAANTAPTKSSSSGGQQSGINYFFNDVDDKSGHLVAPDLHHEEFGPKPPPPSTATTAAYEPTDPYSTAQSSIPNQRSLEDMSYKRLIASKFGEEAPEDINIVEVDVSQHLHESKDWLKTISEEKEDEYKGVEPSSTAKRKHQITFLALQAKQREVALKNEWARNRSTKTQSRAKYGF